MASPSIPWIVRRLEKTYGPRPWRKQETGTGGLVQTILSQSTSDSNSWRAYRSLRRRYPRWEQVLDAPVAAIEEAIRCGGLAAMKAPRIQEALRSIHADRGSLSLAFLARWPVEHARAYLESMDGVGRKTAACVLMFCYNRPALPVDTHVHRVAGRLGLLPDKCSAERAHAVLEQDCPPDRVYSFHVLMVEHGREICRAPQYDVWRVFAAIEMSVG